MLTCMDAMRKPEPTGPRGDVSAEIRALMGRYGTTQTALAVVCGMSQSAFSRKLKGVVAWTVDDLFAVAAYYNVPITALFPNDPEFPLRREWTLLDGEAQPGQMTLPLHLSLIS